MTGRHVCAVRLMGLVLLAAVGVMALAARSVEAQEPTTVQPGAAAIWTDRPQYVIGESIQVCWRIPVPGFIIITDLPADGSSLGFFSGQSAVTGCQPGVITPPAGRECMRLQYPQPGGMGTTQTCFQVVGPNPPPPPPNPATIFVDRASYQVGDAIYVCYRVPGPGPVTIVDVLADGRQQTFFSGYDDGTGGCIPGTVTPPTGTECMILEFGASGERGAPRACFQVTGIPPPGPWTAVGSAQITSNTWNFDGQTTLDPSLTYVRVTSGACTDDPARVLVWESNLQRQSTGVIGTVVWTGLLEPVGLAVSNGGSGTARISRPVTLNPVTQIDATLFQVGLVNVSQTLTVCFRQP